MSVPVTLAAARAAFKEVEKDAVDLEMYSTDYEGEKSQVSVGERRRRVRWGEADPVSTISLVLNDSGVLLWRDGSTTVPFSGGARKRGLAPPEPEGDLVEFYQFEKLEPNEVQRFLSRLDTKLNPARGLFPLLLTPAKGGQPAEATIGTNAVVPAGKKRRLLFIHGTFSSGNAYREGFSRASGGGAFVEKIFKHYDEILSFEHPTLSVSPMLNGFDLARLMAAADGPLDIVAHSRGGLVTRWFLEGFGGNVGNASRRAVLVGSPLGGTSLASPRRLKDALSQISNFGTALKLAGGAASAFVPLLVAPLALLRIATSVAAVGAKTPLLDGAVAMIPGLAGQSRVADSPEIVRLRSLTPAKSPIYSAVRSNFETEKVGWRFWEWFRADKLKDVGADKIFPSDNDLVVDTSSMIELANTPILPKTRVWDFGSSATVHHTNYFEQPETLKFITEQFGVP